MLTYVLLVVGFPVLIYGAEYLVTGASAIAKRIGVSDLLIGLTIVAFGTSAPELAVNLFAAIGGNSGVTIGNVIGSNIANILLILGVAGMIYPLAVQRKVIRRDIPYAILALLVVGGLGFDLALGRGDGLVLLGFFAIFMGYLIMDAIRGEHDLEEVEHKSIWLSLLMIIGGIAGLVLGGQWIVEGAVAVARVIGVSDKLIGLTIVAFGTSLPELATSVAAVLKRNFDMSIGNVVGSNIFNTLLVFGASSVAAVVSYDVTAYTDWGINLLATLLLLIVLAVSRRSQLGRPVAGLFLVMYIGYIVMAVLRG